MGSSECGEVVTSKVLDIPQCPAWAACAFELQKVRLLDCKPALAITRRAGAVDDKNDLGHREGRQRMSLARPGGLEEL